MFSMRFGVSLHCCRQQQTRAKELVCMTHLGIVKSEQLDGQWLLRFEDQK